jgi:hypothetical protein
VNLAPALALALSAAAPAQAKFDPVEFFRGHSVGRGELKILLQSPLRVDVKSEGRTEKDGTLLLIQRVHQQGQKERTRYWRLKRQSATHFTGTLTDAAGPVAVDVVGNRARIRYRMKNRMSVEQWLTPAGHNLVNNQMRVRRFGVVVARLNETIRKLD